MKEGLIQNAQAMQKAPQQKQASVTALVNDLLDRDGMRKRFDELLGKRAPQFISSIISMVNADKNLQQAFYESPMTVIQSSLKAAMFDLPIDPSLGYAYDFIAFDELTHFTWEEYSYLFSRNRPNGPGTRVYIRSTANPGGVGHGWVKERFITAAPPMRTIREDAVVRFPDGHEEHRQKSRIFVPSTVFDNKILLKNDDSYLTRLASMPEAEKNALLYGDWDTFSGQVFTEWRNDSEHYRDRINTHVIAPFHVPKEWPIWCAMDWGYSRPFAIGWFAVDQDRRLYHIREYYGCTGTPNEGVKMEPTAVAREMKRIEAEDPNLKGRSIFRVGDPAIWGTQGTESIGALFERERVYFEKGDNARIDGKMQLHNRFAFDENGVPMLYIFDTCKNFIRTVPNLVYDEKDVEDVNTEQEDHIYDMTRYVCMENPIAARVNKPPKLVSYDPLDINTPSYDRYAWFQHN